MENLSKSHDLPGAEISSLLHGALMEFIDAGYAGILHRSELKPYSQHVELIRGSDGSRRRLRWVITAMTDEAEQNIIDKIIAENPAEIFLKHKSLRLAVKSISVSRESYEQLMERTYFADCSRYIDMEFLTPTAFKTGGKYQFYPSVRLLFQSLMNKHDRISETSEIFSDDILSQIEENVEIIKYRLRSVQFHLEGIKIPSFVGSITLKCHGHPQFSNLINMLAELGEYSGAGIKTAIGMGAVRIIHDVRKEEKDG